MLRPYWRVASAHAVRKAAAVVLKPTRIRCSFQAAHIPRITLLKICTPRAFCSATLNDDAKSPPEAAEEGNNRDYAYYIKILRHTAKHRLHEEAFQTLDYMKTDEGILLCQKTTNLLYGNSRTNDTCVCVCVCVSAVEATTHSFNMMLVSCIKKPEIIAKLITKINKSAVKPDLATGCCCALLLWLFCCWWCLYFVFVQ